jgi:ParB/RepB/Spo0J family partition protein
MNSVASRESRRVNVAEPEIVWLSPDMLVPNKWNPNKMDAFMYTRAIESIKEYGFIDPITARPARRKYEIIDGEHRWRGAIDLGLTLVPVFVLELNDARARKLTVLLNELRGSSDPSSMGELLRTLLSTESIESLTETLPFTSEAINAMVGMKDIDWDVMAPEAKVKSEGVKEKWVERTYRMPAGVGLVLDEAIEKAKDGETMDSWKAIEIIAAEFLAG